MNKRRTPPNGHAHDAGAAALGVPVEPNGAMLEMVLGQSLDGEPVDHLLPTAGDAAGAVAEFERLLEIQLALFDEWDSEVKVTREQIARWQARAVEPDPDPRRWAADIDDAFWKSVDSQYWRFRERRD